MGVHNQSTTRKTFKMESGKVVREMADDDYHVTVRMGIDANTCNLHGHLYLNRKKTLIEDPITGNMVERRYSTRLATEEERTYIGGKPRHLWIWGYYDDDWPRKGGRLPDAPFRKKSVYRRDSKYRQR